MDDELLELQRQFEFAQQAKSSIRLSERNVVELVQKLQQLQIIDFELLHTVSGKEYITLDQLRNEMVEEVKRLGRVSLIDLADATGVDLYYVEKQAQSVVTAHQELMLTQGEIMSGSYWDSIAEEINERLQECSQIALTEIAAQLNVGLDLVASVLEPRLGTIVKGRLEGGQLYTPAYVARVGAMVRGAVRGTTVPTNLTVVWSSLQQLLQEIDGTSGLAVEGSFFQSLFNGLVKEGEVLGSLRAGVHWTPAVFAVAQREFVESFFSQNSFITYEALHKLGIPQPIQFLQSRYPEGKPLVTTFVHPSVIEMLDAATEDAIDRGSWSDSLSLLPSSFTPQDASRMLSFCQSVQNALKSNKAHIFGDFYVLSSSFIKDICDRVVKELEILGVSRSVGTTMPGDVKVPNEAKVGRELSRLNESNEMASDGGANRQADKGSKKKKGKATGNAVVNISESGADNQEQTLTKSKRGQKKGKDTSAQTADSKTGSRKELLKIKEEDLSPSEEWIMQKITALVSDFEEQGIDDPEIILRPLANQLRPTIISSWMEKKKSLLTNNADRIKRLLDNLQKKLDESFLNMQLYEKALELFEDDQSTSVVLHRHLLRTVAAPMVDLLLRNLDEHNKLKNGLDVQEAPNSEFVSLSPADRTAISKSFPGALAFCHNKTEFTSSVHEQNRTPTMNDSVDKLVIFLAKRDGIDKLVKTFQYVSKLVNWHVEATSPDISKRFKQWEVASGLSRKAFRTGRFLTGFNALRRNPGATHSLRLLAVFANAGEMVYFFFDHFLWLARIGTIDVNLAKRMSFISAFGESVGYVFFIIADFIMLRKGVKEERKVRSCKEKTEEEEKRIEEIRSDRVMRLMGVAANFADLLIAVAEIEPNRFCNHTVTLGISGLVSAWAGWYRNWPL